MGPVAVVTGGCSGIGAATVTRLTDDGCTVAVFDLPGSPGPHIDVDVSDPASVEAAVKEVLGRHGRIDVLVNNAGIGRPEARRCHETSVSDFDRIVAVNVRGPFLCARAVLPAMIEQGSGHIIQLASVASWVSMQGRCAYTTSKGAALMFAKSLAVDYARHGIRSNAILPGPVETPLLKARLDDPATRAEFIDPVPLGRPAQPEEIAEAISLLATGRLSYANGAAIVLDGGYTAL